MAARTRNWSPSLTDVAIAIGAAVVEIVHAVVLSDLPGEPNLRPVTTALLLGQTLPLIWRRRHPWVVASVCGLLVAIYGGTESPDPFPVGPLVAFATLIASIRPRIAAVVLVWALAGAFVSTLVTADSDPADYVLAVLLIVLTWFVGYHLQLRSAYLAEMEAKAARLERDQREAAERAAAAERARIARELHDVVSHHVSMMVIQAEAAAVGGAGSGTFDDIAATGRDALGELRRLLGVLRDDSGAPLSPQPRLAELDELARPLRRAGIAVDLRVDGVLDDLPAGLQLCAYRIVQEALTNVARHAQATRASVALARGADGCLDIEVRDDGQAGVGSDTPSADHHGLLGIRERVALYGGALHAGPEPGGGFLVSARLPLMADR